MPSSLLLLCLLLNLDLSEAQNVACMTLHCLGSMIQCFSNADCKDAITCLGGCGSNQTCALSCLSTYENRFLDNFVYCAITQHHCIKLPGPNPPFECTPPAAPPLDNFTLPLFSGKWYVIFGRDRNSHDCYDCQLSTYTRTSSRNYTLIERYLAPTLNHSTRFMTANMTAEVKLPTHGGVVTYSGLEYGLALAEEWRVLVYDNVANYSIIYYCGEAGSWKYEGAFVYSRRPVLSSSDVTKLRTDMDRVGFKIEDFCTPRTTNCSESV